jgi:undecaprenyl-diphosphatase
MPAHYKVGAVETRFLLAVHELATPGLDRLFLLSHDLGTVWFCVPLVLAVAFWHWGREEKREARVWILVGLSTYAIQEGVKRLLARPRPELWARLVEAGPHAFPSGHALASATLFPLLAFDLSRGASAAVRAWAMSAAILLSLMVGFGRLYLGLHWPSDVLAGWAVGTAQAVIAVRRLRRAPLQA